MKRWMRWFVLLGGYAVLSLATARDAETVSLRVQDADLRTVLAHIGQASGLRVRISDSVQGHITLDVRDMPWQQALERVLSRENLVKHIKGNTLSITPADEEDTSSIETMPPPKTSSPLRREVLPLGYARAADVAALLRPASGGSVMADERTNSLIVELEPAALTEMRRLLARLDVPVRQVMIEARIVEANVGYDQSLGVRWGGSVPLTPSGNWTLRGQAGSGAALPFVDLGTVASTSAAGIGFVTDGALLDLQLSAMERTGNGEVVSQPRVMTSDKETARILKGAEVPYSTVSDRGTEVQFKEAVLALEVTPQIMPDNRIIMAVRVTKDEPDFSRALNGIPPIKKNEVTANVRVTDGETVVIGGVFSSTQGRSVEKVPVLGDLPGAGRLFRREVQNEQKSELLVFLTPRIMADPTFPVSR